MGKDNTEHVLPQRQCADRRVSKDWVPFGQNLYQVLARLEEDQFLILSAKRGHRFPLVLHGVDSADIALGRTMSR